METVEKQLDEVKEIDNLLLNDIRKALCDRCGNIPAKGAVIKQKMSLFFCGHHLRLYAPKLIGTGFIIKDPLEELNYGKEDNRQLGENHS